MNPDDTPAGRAPRRASADDSASTSALLPDSDPALVNALEKMGLDVRVRVSDRLASSHDASHYVLLPRAVVKARDATDVSTILSVGRARGASVTFRSGGTSLSGQAGSNSVLVDVRRGFRRVEVLDGGALVRAQPGATVRAVNSRLLRYGRKLGPDPASEIACTIGGIVANNSSGMCCGIHSNAYKTVASMILVLPSGTVVDTGAEDAGRLLAEREPQVVAGLERIRDRVRADRASVATVRRLFAMKNTMGYGLNALLDHDDPVRILEHLVIGSEGTLAFVAETTFHTLPIRPFVATGLLVFPGLVEATAALPALVDAQFAAIELLDAAALRVAQGDRQAPSALRDIPVVNHAALLVEFQEASQQELEKRVAAARNVFSGLPLTGPGTLTTDPATRDALWHVRKGLFTAVAGARPSGTSALLEDIAVPVHHLADTCRRLVRLFERYGYAGSVIFGHAKDGNVHFLINERFDDADGVARYAAFTEDLVDLVLSMGGTLKAEHGTGRVMAPFVRQQYGEELYQVMWELKGLLDPEMILNPGVLLSDDPRAHLQYLKTAPSVEPEVDRCVECGYCEPACPSRDLTLTPRERIVMRRELQAARDRGDAVLASTIEKEYEYDGVQTCAVDGMCQTACPVLINTGDLVRRLRAESQTFLPRSVWKVAAKHWDAATAAAGAALTVADRLPTVLTATATIAGRRILGDDSVPLYTPDLPPGGTRRRPVSREDALAVFVPSCTATMFGPVGGDAVSDAFQRLCARAGVPIAIPRDIPSLCCGTPWKSKGLTDGYRIMQQKVTASLDLATNHGRLPVVCDASSCTEGLQHLLDTESGRAIRVIDAVAFVDEYVLPHLPPAHKAQSLALHPTCSSQHLGLEGALARVAAAAAETVIIPDDWGCCGFAGDRGMLHPELTSSATTSEAAQVRAAAATHASLNRTCELGLTRATGHPYRHVLQVLDDALADASLTPRVE